MGLKTTHCLEAANATFAIIENVFDGFHDLVCLLTYSQTQAAAVSILAELVVDTINAADLITLIHSAESSNDPLQCASYENIQRNIMICMAVFAVVNIKEMKKAFSIIRNVKTKCWGKTQSNQFEQIANRVDGMTRKMLGRVSVLFGTNTRMAGTVSSMALSISNVQGVLAKQPCMQVPWWGWLVASLAGLGLAPYKYHFLAGTNWSKCMVNFWTGIYAFTKNMPLFTGRIADIIVTAVQRRTEGSAEVVDIDEQIFWGIMAVLAIGIFIPAQVGLNKHAATAAELALNNDAVSADDDSLASSTPASPLLPGGDTEQYTRFQRIRAMVLASAGSASLTALAITQAPVSLARHGNFNTPRDPAEVDERAVLLLQIFGGAAFFLYYYCRLYLGLSNL